MAAFRENLRDDAVALAKKWRHETVELRHLAAALLKVSDSDQAALARLLDPRGEAVVSPELTEETEGLLQECDSMEDAIGALRATGCLPAELDGLEIQASASESEGMNGGHGSESRSLELIMADIVGLVGLGPVKKELLRLVSVHRLNSERAGAGLASVPVGLHLVFTGSPGTGKTTVARLVAELYRALGLLSKGHLVEVHRADLVAGYVGQTASRVETVFRSAMGGMLFIDEAYALLGSGSDYGAEAVATLVKLMEDHREHVAVVVAGYPDPMREFIASNAGLRSRFGRFVHFPDYDVAELTEIFATFCDGSGVGAGEDVMARVRRSVERAPTEVRAGNGRFVRNLFEESYGRMASRAAADGVIEEHELIDMQPEDVPMLDEGPKEDYPGQYL